LSDTKTGPLLIEAAGNGGIYIVQQGDNLTTILNRNAQSTLASPHDAIQEVLQDNPHITNANRIYPGQPIFLRSAGASGKPLSPATASDLRSALITLNTHRSTEMSALVQNSDAISLVLGFTQNLTQQFGTLVSSNQRGLNELIAQHRAYRFSGVTASGYRDFNRSRSTVLQTMQRDFGKAAKPLLGATPKQATTLQPGRSANPTVKLSTSATRLANVSKAMKAGGFVLQAADIAVTAEVTRQKVCAADSRALKNQEFASGMGAVGGSLGGSAVGAAAGGVVVAVVLGSNPAGWAVLLIVGVAGAAGGFAGSKAGGAAAKKVYTEFGNGYDMVDAAGVDALCN
jgi:hypothetical protein